MNAPLERAEELAGREVPVLSGLVTGAGGEEALRVQATGRDPASASGVLRGRAEARAGREAPAFPGLLVGAGDEEALLPRATRQVIQSLCPGCATRSSPLSRCLRLAVV